MLLLQHHVPVKQLRQKTGQFSEWYSANCKNQKSSPCATLATEMKIALQFMYRNDGLGKNTTLNDHTCGHSVLLILKENF